MSAKERAGVVVARLRAMGDPATIRGRARFGIPEADSFGVRLPALRGLAKELGTDHALAKALWRSGSHEARLLATLVADPARVTVAEAEGWLRETASWDLCDGLCLNLLDRAPWAHAQARRWCAREDEWTKRAGFATMAGLASHDKAARDAVFLGHLRTVERYADDERHFVKKAASWAIRGVGKRNARLRGAALGVARRLAEGPGMGARWVGRDAVRELAA